MLLVDGRSSCTGYGLSTTLCVLPKEAARGIAVQWYLHTKGTIEGAKHTSSLGSEELMHHEPLRGEVQKAHPNTVMLLCKPQLPMGSFLSFFSGAHAPHAMLQQLVILHY